MAENSKIEWCHHTVNLWWGCAEVHEGCDNCYARTLDNRYHKNSPHWGPHSARMIVLSAMKDLDRYQKKAAAANEMHRVFIGSMMDIFEKSMPILDSKGNEHDVKDTGWLRNYLFQSIDAGKYPNLLLLFLTKRPGNINKYIPEHWQKNGAPKNVMFGTSVVNQETADRMIPELLKVNGRRFLSLEPLIGKVNTSKDYPGMTQMLEGIHWIIVGGESGHKARPMDANWAELIKRDCEAAKVPFFMKQGSENNWGDYKNIESFPKELQVRQFPSWYNWEQMEAKMKFMNGDEEAELDKLDREYREHVMTTKPSDPAIIGDGILPMIEKANDFPRLPENSTLEDIKKHIGHE